MKLIKSILLIATLCITSNIANAQFGIGPMLVYGSQTELGFGVKAKFGATDQIQISPSFALLESTEIFGIKATSSEINADAQYYFNPDANTQIYGLAGLNMVFAKLSGSGVIESESSSEIGLNLGGGAEFSISESIMGFAQAKYTVSKADQLGIHTGIYFTFGG